jgi:hypothetical protein
VDCWTTAATKERTLMTAKILMKHCADHQNLIRTPDELLFWFWDSVETIAVKEFDLCATIRAKGISERLAK